jgi:hypothetical protein
VLKKYGDVSVIDYRSKFAAKGMTLLRYGIKFRDMLRVAKDIFRIFPRYRVIKKFEEFNKSNFNMTKTISTEQDFYNLNQQFDVFVSGSDQIWNPDIVSEQGNIDRHYFLDFVNDGKRISYGSSLGTYVYSEHERTILVELLQKYHDISVREKDSAIYLSRLLERPVKHVLDPSLLLTREQWLNLFAINEVKRDASYILVYALKKDNILKETIQEVSNVLKIKVIAIDQDPFINFKHSKHIRDAGPDEFVELFSKADFVITNSFHGTCFSINFNIPFIVTTPPTGVNRINSLLSELKITNRLISESKKASKVVNEDIDYKNVSKKLDVLREDSLRFINDAVVS